jgi:hypothetical protein
VNVCFAYCVVVASFPYGRAFWDAHVSQAALFQSTKDKARTTFQLHHSTFFLDYPQGIVI